MNLREGTKEGRAKYRRKPDEIKQDIHAGCNAFETPEATRPAYFFALRGSSAGLT